MSGTVVFHDNVKTIGADAFCETNITSLTIFLLGGQTVILLGLAAAVCNMAGNYVGASLAMTKGSKITRPVILLVLALLFLKVLGII